VTADSPITLEEACRLFPQARLKVSTLRTAADKGELVIFKLGRQYHTTPGDMDDWVKRCREEGSRRAYGSTSDASNGSSETEQRSSARAAANLTVEKLKQLSKRTSPASTGRSPAPRRSSTMS
jgi:hypothetical protein